MCFTHDRTKQHFKSSFLLILQCVSEQFKLRKGHSNMHTWFVFEYLIKKKKFEKK
jgi:hypothetical protein